jgi:hypothetical protein
MKKPSIPSINVKDGELQRVLLSLKENAEIINGTRIGKIATLNSGATNIEVIDKINEIIERLNA